MHTIAAARTARPPPVRMNLSGTPPSCSLPCARALVTNQHDGAHPSPAGWLMSPGHCLRTKNITALTSCRPSITRIPAATRRKRGEVRASQAGPELPRLHALPTPMACRGSTLMLPHSSGLVIAQQTWTYLFHRPGEGFPPGPERPGLHPRRNPMTQPVAAAVLELAESPDPDEPGRYAQGQDRKTMSTRG